MLEAVFKYDFLQNALLASLFSAVICGIIGVIASQKKLLMMTGGIAHTAYGGVGLGYLLGFEPIIGAGIFAVAAAFTVGSVRKKGGVHTDIVISLLWSLGMALGIAFTGLMPGYPPDMNSYLFGNILTVTRKDIYFMAALTAVILFCVIMLYNDWLAFLFDSRFSAVAGMKTAFLEYLLLILIALSIIGLIRVVGIILVIALLSAPAATASFISKSFKGQMLTAALLCFAFCFTGLFISYNLGIASGAAIVFVAAAVYFTFFLLSKLKKNA